jgi:hypothetical protein
VKNLKIIIFDKLVHYLLNNLNEFKFGIVERDRELKTRVVKHANGKNHKSIIRQNVSKDAILMSDEFDRYKDLNKEFKEQNVVILSKKQYVVNNIHANQVFCQCEGR